MKRFAWFVTKKKMIFTSRPMKSKTHLCCLICIKTFASIISRVHIHIRSSQHIILWPKPPLSNFQFVTTLKKKRKTLGICSRGQAFFWRLMSRSKMLPVCDTGITDAHQCAAPMGSGLDWTSWVNMGVSSDTDKASVQFRSKRLHSHTGPKQPKSNFFSPPHVTQITLQS